MRQLLLLGILSVSACQSTVDPDVESNALYGDKSIYWTGSPILINVCWDNASNGMITTDDGVSVPESYARQWVRSAIEQNWQRFGRINFTNWTTDSTCPTLYSGAPNLHIQVINSGNSCTGNPCGAQIGKNLAGVSGGVSMDLYWTSGNADCKKSETNLINCIKAQAVHEFGHVMAYYHENQRPDDSTDTCFQSQTPGTSPQYYGAVDKSSVMYTCQGSPPNWFQNISPGDIAGMETGYGRRIHGQILDAYGATCMSSNISPANDIFNWPCDEAPGQIWSYNFGNHTFQLSTHGYTAYLDDYQNDGIGYKPWMNTSFIGDQFQQYTLDNMYLRSGWGSLCLDLINGNTTNGNNVQLYACGALDGQNQVWTVRTDNRIQFGNTSKCLTYTGNNGDPFTIWDCGASGKNQTFTFGSDGSLRLSAYAGKCADAQAWTTAQYAPGWPTSGQGIPSNGAKLQTYSCLSSQLNQKWNLSGPIVNNNGYCLDGGQHDSQGYDYTWQSCIGSLTQTFDIYW